MTFLHYLKIPQTFYSNHINIMFKHKLCISTQMLTFITKKSATEGQVVKSYHR